MKPEIILLIITGAVLLVLFIIHHVDRTVKNIKKKKLFGIIPLFR